MATTSESGLVIFDDHKGPVLQGVLDGLELLQRLRRVRYRERQVGLAQALLQHLGYKVGQ